MLDFSTSTLIFYSAIAYTTYLISLVIYRLYFHPLSSIPGPKLAAATLLYEFYHDVIQTGTYIWRIRELHLQYGPIIRISPDCVHINDPDFYEIYSGRVGERRDKYPWALTHFATPEAFLSTVDHDHHRARRGAVSKYFSKANIRSLEPVVQQNVAKLLGRIREFEGPKSGNGKNGWGEPFNIWNGFKALTSDIVTTCAFGESHDYLSKPDFNQGFWKVFAEACRMDAFTNHVSWFLPVMMGLPESVQEAMGLGYMVVFKKKSYAQLEAMVANKDLEEKGTKTIFRDVLNSNLPEAEKSLERMWHDGQVFNIAGSETTAWALALCTVHLISNPDMMSRLSEELKGVLRDGTVEGVMEAELEALPYLTAVIKESLRLSHGVAGRLYRVSPDKAQVFNDGKRDWILPAGTPIAMTAPLIHLNASVFSAPETFNPSRWLDNPALDKYLVSFSRGPRACVGLNLAWAELYFAVAGVVGRYGCEGEGRGPSMKLWNTDVDDVVLKHDFFVPGQSEETAKKGILVQVCG